MNTLYEISYVAWGHEFRAYVFATDEKHAVEIFESVIVMNDDVTIEVYKTHTELLIPSGFYTSEPVLRSDDAW